LLDAAELIVNLVGKGTIKIMERDMNFPQRGSLDISAAKQDLGFDPKVDIEQGVARYIEWVNNSNYWNSKF
jgi:nucleoside-diphosphate-sugar epimerase